MLRLQGRSLSASEAQAPGWVGAPPDSPALAALPAVALPPPGVADRPVAWRRRVATAVESGGSGRTDPPHPHPPAAHPSAATAATAAGWENVTAPLLGTMSEGRTVRLWGKTRPPPAKARPRHCKTPKTQARCLDEAVCNPCSCEQQGSPAPSSGPVQQEREEMVEASAPSLPPPHPPTKRLASPETRTMATAPWTQPRTERSARLVHSRRAIPEGTVPAAMPRRRKTAGELSTVPDAAHTPGPPTAAGAAAAAAVRRGQLPLQQLLPWPL